MVSFHLLLEAVYLLSINTKPGSGIDLGINLNVCRILLHVGYLRFSSSYFSVLQLRHRIKGSCFHVRALGDAGYL